MAFGVARPRNDVTSLRISLAQWNGGVCQFGRPLIGPMNCLPVDPEMTEGEIELIIVETDTMLR